MVLSLLNCCLNLGAQLQKCFQNFGPIIECRNGKLTVDGEPFLDGNNETMITKDGEIIWNWAWDSPSGYNSKSNYKSKSKGGSKSGSDSSGYIIVGRSTIVEGSGKGGGKGNGKGGGKGYDKGDGKGSGKGSQCGKSGSSCDVNEGGSRPIGPWKKTKWSESAFREIMVST